MQRIGWKGNRWKEWDGRMVERIKLGLVIHMRECYTGGELFGTCCEGVMFLL